MGFDVDILRFWNERIGFGLGFERFLGYVAFHDLFKGFVVATVFAALWFREDEGSMRRRRILLAGLLGAVLAALLNRLLASVLPFRVRPLQAPWLRFIPPPGARPLAFSHLSAFPSDHAALFLGLALAVTRASVRAGLFLFPWVIVVILLPRLHLGLHWPSDFLAGGLVGCGLVLVFQTEALQRAFADPALALAERRPGLFHALLFFLLLLVATLFHEVAELGWYLTLK